MPEPLLVTGVFVLGMLLGIGLTLLLRGGSERRARTILATAEAHRQGETEALLDGVKLAFGEVSLDSFARIAERLDAQLQARSTGERQQYQQAASAEHAQTGQQLAAVTEQLERLRALSQELERERRAEQVRLESELRQTRSGAEALTQTTRRLADTLMDGRRRGQWGERTAEDVLALAGLVEGVSYRRQDSTGDGRRPDISFVLPEGSLLHMDVKFPFDNFARAQAADEPSQRARHEAAFVRDVRQRLQEVVDRDYAGHGSGGLGVALLFVPNEGVFQATLRLDPDLIDQAIGKGVVLVSPLTLLAVLAVIRRAAKLYRLSHASRELAASLTDVQDAWQRWGGEAQLAAKRLEDAQNTMAGLLGPRRRRLDRALERLLATLDDEAPPVGPTADPTPPAPESPQSIAVAAKPSTSLGESELSKV